MHTWYTNNTLVLIYKCVFNMSLNNIYFFSVRCPYGTSGICGTIAGLACDEGSTCLLDGDYPDAGGVCCLDKPVVGNVKDLYN